MDGARLNTSVQRGDAIIPAANTENLWEWSKISPFEIPSVMSASRMNALAETGYRNISGGAGSDAVLGQILEVLNQFMPFVAEKTRVYLSGKDITDNTSRDMAMRQRRRRG